MAEVMIKVAGHSYQVACRDGEEERLYALAAMVDAKAGQARDAIGGQMSEARALLFAALLLADELDEARPWDISEDAVADVEALADKVTAMSERLAQAEAQT